MTIDEILDALDELSDTSTAWAKAHLADFILNVAFDDEQAAFCAYVVALDDVDLAYYADEAGWRPMFEAFRESVNHSLFVKETGS